MHPWNNSSQIIIHPDQDSQVGSSVPLFRISLSADDSESHDDAVLQQRISSSWSLLSFFSKKLFAPAPSYSCFQPWDTDCLPHHFYFRFLLEGRQFTLFMYHPLTHALFRVSLPLWLDNRGSTFSNWSSQVLSNIHLDLRMVWLILYSIGLGFLCLKLLLHGISHTKTNSLERFRCSLKNFLSSRLEGSGWIHYLPLVLLGLCNALKDYQACFLAEAVYGTPLMLPGMFLNALEFLSLSHPFNPATFPWELKFLCLFDSIQLLLLSILCIKVLTWFYRKMISSLFCS